MEDVLDLYEEPYDPQRPVVCFDEQSYQLISETRDPLPMTPQHPKYMDYEYVREGTCNLFLYVQPQGGWRHVEVTQRRTAPDFAQRMKELGDIHVPDAQVIRLVMDNLNTHTPAALYETFPPAEARRLLRKLEIHDTPKHGSWLNMAEIELAVLTGQCLARRLPSTEHVRHEIGAWEQERNAEQRTISWSFTTPAARAKLGRLYPQLEEPAACQEGAA